MSESIVIRPGTLADLKQIRDIQDAEPGAAHWPPREYFKHHVLVAVLEDQLAGFVVWMDAGPDEAEILNIAVRPRLRMRGIASVLLKAALDAAPATFFLEVRESNEAARALYRKLGFAEVGIRPGYYENPPESAVVMKFCS
jgi:ribosomal-protein-alanine N-acetyltransferase